MTSRLREAQQRADEIEASLRSIGTPERAIAEKRYLKSDLEFLGATVWQIRAAVRDFIGQRPPLDHAALIALVTQLWEKPIHERRMAAVMLLERHPRLLDLDDLALVERLIRESRTWALVDFLAGDVASRLVAEHPASASILGRWATDPDFWLRRSALLAELRPLRAGADLARFAGHADAMLEDREFFIRKAIGWVLRETAKRRPDEVRAWLAPRTHRASGVTMREAVKYLQPRERDALMAAHRERRPAS